MNRVALWARVGLILAIGGIAVALCPLLAASAPSPAAPAGKFAYSIRVQGLAADGVVLTVLPPAAEPETIVIPVPGDPIELYDWPWEEARYVRWCESRDDPTKTGRAGEWGWFQVHPRWHSHRLRDGEDPYDIWVNTRMAYEIWLESGRSWWQWAPVCRP